MWPSFNTLQWFLMFYFAGQQYYILGIFAFIHLSIHIHRSSNCRLRGNSLNFFCFRRQKRLSNIGFLGIQTNSDSYYKCFNSIRAHNWCVIWKAQTMIPKFNIVHIFTDSIFTSKCSNYLDIKNNTLQNIIQNYVFVEFFACKLKMV